jgi:hypothetical protein
VHLVRAIPSEVRIRFERRAERTVKVAPRFRDRDGYEVANFIVKPDSVAIAGPASHVAQIDNGGDGSGECPGQGGRIRVPGEHFRGRSVRSLSRCFARNGNGDSQKEIGKTKRVGKQLFGTDGIRGVAGEYPLDPATVYAFGLALGHDAARAQSNARRF